MKGSKTGPACLHPSGAERAHPSVQPGTALGREISLFYTGGLQAFWQKPQHCILSFRFTYLGPEADRSLGEGLRVIGAGSLARQVQDTKKP